ncbi:MAG TPA: M1 family metallopeptidase [Verrucomicrobiae bacterium]|jgi:aminopeptidase N|nr:M1 family metallopeptidase [Verrucomicrobiae bacterium]
MSKKVTRLYAQFQPEHYQLALTLDKDAMAFHGTVTVRGKKIGRPSQRLTFHQKDLKITSATIVKHDKKGDVSLPIKRINNQNSFDEVRLHTGGMVYPGQYTVVMEFNGKITKHMNGIYPCFFTHDGQDKKLLATQFESHFARNAFPCIDEPEAKATFDLTLTSPVGETVISNTPVKEHHEKDKLQTNSFETTPKMSTYLLAFVLGEMGYEEGTTKSGTVIRSYATPDNARFAKSSVQDAVKIVEFFEDYFAIPYPLQKLDMVALPDFTVGAMENWGLMTFRESILLVDEESTSIESRQVSALVICHEVSHQWFGNLVTMKWWDDLWLNESFANMMEYRGVDAIFPEWNIWEQFVSHESVSAKRRDSLSDVQPVHIDVNHPEEINTVFDPSIVYAKGGTLLHMLMHYLGEDVFRKGLQAYFKQHQYGNTQAADLWTAFSKASGQDIDSFMENWLSKPGYPLVDVDWKPGAPELNLSQQRFLSDPTSKDAAKTIWQVPLAPTVPLMPSILKTVRSQAHVEKADQVLMLNHNGTSYFVPRYSNADHLEKIRQAISDKKVSDIDRLLLLDNYILLQRGGMAETVELLDLVSSYKDEPNENVWGLLSMSIGEVRRLIESDDKINDKLNTMVQELVTPLLPKFGWDDKPSDTTHTLRMRGLVYSLAVGAQDRATIDTALHRFAKLKKPSDLPASTRSVSYFAAARYGKEADFQKLLHLYRTIPSHDEKEETAAGFTAAKKPAQIKELLAMLMTKDIRNQDLPHMIAWMLRNRYARANTWQWVQDNWQWLVDELSGDKQYDTLPRYSGSVFSNTAELQSYTAFFEPKKSEIALQRAIVLGEQEIRGRIAWRERNEAAVKKYLS